MSDPSAAVSSAVSAALWAALADDIAAVPSALAAAGAFDAEGLRYALRYLAAGIETCIEAEDRGHPVLRYHIEPGRTWGLDNPDCRYRICGIDPAATFRLTGDPGTCTRLEFQINTGHLGDGQFADWQCLGRLDDRDLVAGPDGSVTIVIAPHDPGDAANWLRSGPDATYLQVREYSSDWESERPSTFAIERIEQIDQPLGKDSIDDGEITRRVELLRDWLTIGSRCWAELGGGLAGGVPGPINAFLPPASATGLGGLAYGMGAFVCEPGTATVVEFTPPRCAYWSVSLSTRWWESPDLSFRQCSLNHHQAAIDADGVVRFAIAVDDPRVANWLDPGGHERGTLAVRFLDADIPYPTVTQHAVPLDVFAAELSTSAELSTWANVSTPFSAAERYEQLRRRRVALARRFAR